MFSEKQNVNILTALLVAHDVRHIVVCPGSRNAPLVHNFSECKDIVCHPVTDERSAGFIALGLRQQLQKPVAVCVTSGSALLNVLPAAAEATYQHQGIIVISADRPAEWIDQLDGQTLPQQGALGRFVAKSVSLPEVTSPDSHWYCNRLVNEAIMECWKPAHPSVHINVPITEPLFKFNKRALPDERMIHFINWSNEYAQSHIISMIENAERPMLVIGQVPQDSMPDDYLSELSQKIVVLYEPLSMMDDMPPCPVDQMLYAIGDAQDDYLPDCVIFLGGHTVSKRLRQFLRNVSDEAHVIMANVDGAVQDVTKHADYVVQCSPGAFISDLNGMVYDSPNYEYVELWNDLCESVMECHEEYQPGFSSMLAVKLFEEQVEETDKVYYANSMAVRLAAIYANRYCFCNRGLNGIEGSLSVAAGAALAMQSDEFDAYEPMRVYCVIGDLSFFYDENALWQQELTGNFRVLLLNNKQGTIFRNLPGLDKSPVRDSLVSAAHSVTAEGICKQFGITYLQATDEASLYGRINDFFNAESDRPVLLEVLTDADSDEAAYKGYYGKLKN